MADFSFSENLQNLGAKLLKQQILLLKKLQFKTVCKDDSGYITQLKQQK